MVDSLIGQRDSVITIHNPEKTNEYIEHYIKKASIRDEFRRELRRKTGVI